MERPQLSWRVSDRGLVGIANVIRSKVASATLARRPGMNRAVSEGLHCGSTQSVPMRAGVTNGVNDETVHQRIAALDFCIRARL